MTPYVRRPTPEDVPAILTLARQFYGYSKARDRGLPYTDEGMTRALYHYAMRGDTLLLVAEVNKKIVASLCAVLAPWFLDPSVKVAIELWLWGNEAAGSGRLLKETMEVWARDRGATSATMSRVLTGCDSVDAAMARLYRSWGYERAAEVAHHKAL